MSYINKPIIITDSTDGSSLLFFFLGTSDEESCEDDGVGVTTASERFFSEGQGPFPISMVGVDDLLSESLEASDLRLRPLGDFFLALLEYQLRNKATLGHTVSQTYCLAASWALFNSFCLTILNSLYFKTRSSGTHSSQLKVFND